MVKQNVDAQFLSLSQNLACKAQLGVTALKNVPKDISYDYSFTAVQDVIRMWFIPHIH